MAAMSDARFQNPVAPAICVDVVDDFEALEGLREEWAAVYAADPDAHVYLSHMWLTGWLQVHRTPWLILAARPDFPGAGYIAFLPVRLPVWLEPGQGFLSRLILGGDQFSDYNGLLCRPEWEAQVVPLFARHLRNDLKWGELRLDNLRMSDRRRRLLLEPFDKIRFQRRSIPIVDVENGVDNDVCPYADLPEDFEAYLATLSPNSRQKLRRMLRRLESCDDYRVSFADSASYANDLSALLGLWRTKWAPQKGDRTEGLVANNFRMLLHCAEEGRLFLPVLRKGDTVVAALAIVIDAAKRSFHFVIAGRDETVTDLSPGLLLHAVAIRHAISQGIKTYDFLRGDEAYKFLFGVRTRRIETVAFARAGRRNATDILDRRALPAMVEEASRRAQRAAFGDAELACRQILELDPDNAQALYLLGQSLAWRRDFTQAKAAFRRSVTVEPEGDNAWSALAHVLEEEGDVAGALDAARTALRFQPGNLMRRKQVARLTHAQGVLLAAPTSSVLDSFEAVVLKLAGDVVAAFDPGPRVDLPVANNP
jgi:CelD/BcsL family acetyltransferase involved in cellulose biosynthesis